MIEYLKPKSASAFCPFDDCRHACGIRLTQEVLDRAKAMGVRVATYKERPQFCYQPKPKDTEE